ncbi:MAG: energy-coupling factor ABC transporter ATP-binding protein [Candidatus Saccharibacteria bacterium]|nr:energy-coupling factor ABC transporter ATP-binding protein [Candidatus Saccharibacteria bacterium]
MLELKNISYEIKQSKQKILDQVSLRIEPGTLTVITGPNGSGKSTLAQIIMGIKTPTSGQIIFGGGDITKDDITARAKKGISFSFQQPVKFQGLTVYELLNIANGELFSPVEAGQVLEQVGLNPDDYLKREINTKLSGGELKRIEIASILARKDAKLLIFDEPEAGIDLWSFQDLTKLFQKIRCEYPDKSLVIISHQEKILKIADEIIILENGSIAKKGAPAQIISEIKEAKP